MKIFFQRDVGNLFHYGHFIVDAVIPFIEYYSTHNAGGSITTAMVMDRTDQHMGGFTKFFEALFPSIRIEYVPQHVFENDPSQLMTVRGYKFGPYPTIPIIWAESNLGWGGGGDHHGKHVLLVDRGFRRIDLPSHCHANRNDTGSMRRRLHNQHDVNQTVQQVCDQYNFPLCIVQLENLSLEEQQKLFAQAVIVIGQHGAGLCNLLFARRGQGHLHHILEVSHWGLKTIQHIALAKEWSHHIIKSSMKQCDTAHLRSVLNNICLQLRA